MATNKPTPPAPDELPVRCTQTGAPDLVPQSRDEILRELDAAITSDLIGRDQVPPPLRGDLKRALTAPVALARTRRHLTATAPRPLPGKAVRHPATAGRQTADRTRCDDMRHWPPPHICRVSRLHDIRNPVSCPDHVPSRARARSSGVLCCTVSPIEEPVLHANPAIARSRRSPPSCATTQEAPTLRPPGAPLLSLRNCWE